MNLKIIAQGVAQIIAKRYTGPFWPRRNWLKKTQYLSKDELACIQLKLLKRIVVHAERYVPYYQMVMKRHGFSAKDIRSLDDIKLFPILTKLDVIDAGKAMLSTAYPKITLRHAFTGGTTGSPLNIFRSPFSLGNEHAFVRRQWDWAGLGFKDICAIAKGHVIENEQNYIYDPIMKELHLSTFNLNIVSAKKYLSILKEYGCKGLVGYPSSIFLMAKAKMDMDIELPIKSILLTSETLDDDMKKYIAQSFGVNVYDFYGSAERVCYIFTCEKGNYHVQPEYGLTELFPVEDGRCKIISTGFWNCAMPLIRYDTGDRVETSNDKCACGREFPTIRKIYGREGDYIITPQNKILGVSILTHAFHVVCGIDCFIESQIIQDRIDHLTIKYIPSNKFKYERIVEYTVKLKECIGHEMKIDFEKVEHIVKTKSGKHKFVVSQIKV